MKSSEDSKPLPEWRPVELGVARVWKYRDGWHALDVGHAIFRATPNCDAFGALCFAYGVETELIDLRTIEASSYLWLAWNFCALISKVEEDEGVPEIAGRGLREAILLATSAELANEVRSRFSARLRLVNAELARLRAERRPRG